MLISFSTLLHYPMLIMVHSHTEGKVQCLLDVTWYTVVWNLILYMFPWSGFLLEIPDAAWLPSAHPNKIISNSVGEKPNCYSAFARENNLNNCWILDIYTKLNIL